MAQKLKSKKSLPKRSKNEGGPIRSEDAARSEDAPVEVPGAFQPEDALEDAIEEPIEEQAIIIDDTVEVLPAGQPEDFLPLDDEGPIPPHAPETSTNRSTKDLVRYDALSAYLSEIRQFPPLSREQEHELAIRYTKHKDLAAAYKLVSSNLWLVVKISRDYERAARSILDLIQEGNIGLLEAIKNFDPYRGVRFPSYAVWWIKAYIVRYIIANWRLVKIGTTQAQRKLFFNLKKEKDRLEREGFRPEPKLLAEKLQVRESDIIEMEQRLGSPEVSFDAPLPSESETTLLSILPDNAPNAEEVFATKERSAMIEEGLNEFEETLNEKERIILREKMLSEDKVTLNEISEKLQISKERVRQIENRIREKLKAFFIKRHKSTIDSIEF